MSKSIYKPEDVILRSIIKSFRLRAGLTQATCAEYFNKPQSFMSDVEGGTRRLDIVQLREICKLFGVSLVEFVIEFENEISKSKI